MPCKHRAWRWTLIFTLTACGQTTAPAPTMVGEDAAVAPRPAGKDAAGTATTTDAAPPGPDAAMPTTGAADAAKGEVAIDAGGRPADAVPPSPMPMPGPNEPSGGGPASVADLPAGDPQLDKLYMTTVAGNVYEMFVPGGIPNIRCIIGGASKRRELARLVNCAQMTLPDGRGDNTAPPTGPGILTALKNFAQLTGHPEVEHLHILGSGYSYTAGQRADQVRVIPGRFLALFTGGIDKDRPMSDAERGIPWISYGGALDLPRDMGLSNQRTVADLRAQGALYTKAIRWGRGHEMGDSNYFMFSFFHQVIARRLPKTVPTDRPVALSRPAETSGWLLDVPGWNSLAPKIAPYASYTGDKTKAGWAIDSYTAHVWRAFTAQASPVSMPTVFCKTCDNCTPLHRKVGTPIPLEATVSGSKRPVKVDLFDGDKWLATATQPPYKFPDATPEPGVHAFISVATFDDGSVAYSRPGTVVVTKVAPTRGAMLCE